MAEAVKKAASAPTLTEEEAVNKSYAIAQRRLREQNLAEFNRLRTQAAKELGYDWHPQPTAEEKAAKQMEELLAEFPGLRDQFGLVEDPDRTKDLGGDPVDPEAQAS